MGAQTPPAALAQPISRLTTIPFPLLAPFMISVICFASFQATRDLADLIALLVIGVTLEMGMIEPQGERTTVRIRSVNTGARLEALVETPGGRVRYDSGDALVVVEDRDPHGSPSARARPASAPPGARRG